MAQVKLINHGCAGALRLLLTTSASCLPSVETTAPSYQGDAPDETSENSLGSGGSGMAVENPPAGGGGGTSAEDLPVNNLDPESGAGGTFSPLAPNARPAPPRPFAFDLDDLSGASPWGVTIQGAAPGDNVGYSVAGAGDVNGDGSSDVIIGAMAGDGIGAGKAYVVFGSLLPGTIDLSALGAGGFVIEGVDPSDNAGEHVAGAGDINGDGLDDVIVSAPGRNTNSGIVYVVLGKADAASIQLAELGAQGFAVEGFNFRFGEAAAGAGDVNGDGFDDVIIGSLGANDYAGGAFVVFGSSAAGDAVLVDLENLGNGGFRIDGTLPGDSAGSSVSAAGDVNADGLDDVIVGVPAGFESLGAAYVVFGKRDTNAVSLAALAAGEPGGFVVLAAHPTGTTGYAVAGAGDVNADGLDDVLVGAPTASAPHLPDSGSGISYLVFGRTTSTPVQLEGTPGESLTIYPAEGGDNIGRVVSGAGDFDGDALDDVLITSRNAWRASSSAPGENCPPASSCAFGLTYVMPGFSPLRALPGEVRLSTLEADGGDGLTIRGVDPDAFAGESGSGAGDFNGDGIDDVIIGAPGENFYRIEEAVPAPGRAYIVFGEEVPGLLAAIGPRTTLIGTAGDDALVYAGGPDRARIDGGNGIDTLRPAAAELGILDLEQTRTLTDTNLGTFDAPNFVTYASRVRGIEIIDLTQSSAAELALDDSAVLRLPHSRPGLPFGLAKTLVVLGDADDRLLLDSAGYELAGMNEGRRMYRRSGTFYGVEVSAEIAWP